MAEPEPITEGPFLVEFESSVNEAPPGTPARPRPPGRPRDAAGPPSESDVAFAREVADRVLEYLRTHHSSLNAEQLTLLVQRILANRKI
jgi:hypothetical protein